VSVQDRRLTPEQAATADAATGTAGGSAGPQQDQPARLEKERGFRPDIQGMRALAVGMVVIYHLYPSALPGGFAGVDVFFVISGFLITGHLLREYQKTGRVALVAFWGKRAKRLMPAAALVLTVTWLVSRLVLPATRLADTATQIRASALYYQNWQLARNAVNYLKADAAASPVQHFWSLSVEEQFYLGWPLLFLLAALAAGTLRRRGTREAGASTAQARLHRGGLVVLLLAAAVVAASLSFSVYYTRANPAAAYFVTTTRIWELGLGGLLALLPLRASQRLSRIGVLGWAGLGLVIASAFVLSGTTAFPGSLALLPAGGAALLILGGSVAGRLGPSRLTSVRPLVFLGGISYSLYLWHWPVIDLYTAWRGHPVGKFSGPVIIVVAVLLSWLTKVWVEDRVRTASLLSGHNWRSVSTALAAALPVALVTAFLVSLPAPFTGQLGPNYPGAAALTASAAMVNPEPVVPSPASIPLPDYWAQGCLVAEGSSTPKECVFGDTTDPVLTVALVGDSNAGDWFTPLQQIAQQRHWKLITDLHAACPLTTTMMITVTKADYTSCHSWGVKVIRQLETTIKPDVVITSDWPGDATVAHPQAGPASQADIGAGMAAYWRQLQAHGMSIVAIKETPNMRFNVPDCVAKYPKAVQAKCSQPASRAIKANMPSGYAVKDAGGSVPLIDLNSLLCGPATCPPVIGNVLVYQDDHHLTSTYTLTAAPYLEQQLDSVNKTLAGS
jgi:peptidoglycan/LPS O-acetylase OafA/YrhL